MLELSKKSVETRKSRRSSGNSEQSTWASSKNTRNGIIL